MNNYSKLNEMKNKKKTYKRIYRYSAVNQRYSTTLPRQEHLW